MKATMFLALLVLGLLVAPLCTDAQPAGKVYRIGWLSPGSPTAPNPNLAAFRQGLRALGYVEGQNLIIESRYAEGSEERLPALAAELVRLQVEVIVAGGTSTIRATQHATHTIPIVMAVSYDPVGRGLIASLARPGGNTTGVSSLGTELPGKRLELLKETVPQSARVAVLANPAAGGYESVMHNLTGAAQALGLHLRVLELRRPEELDTAFATMIREGVDALLVVSDPALMESLRGRVTDLAAHAPAARDIQLERACGGWGPHVLWAKPARHVPARRHLCG